MQFILWSQVWAGNEEFEIPVYTWYKNGISHVYHLSIRVKHESVSRTEPIDGPMTESTKCFMHTCMVSSTSYSGLSPTRHLRVPALHGRQHRCLVEEAGRQCRARWQAPEAC